MLEEQEGEEENFLEEIPQNYNHDFRIRLQLFLPGEEEFQLCYIRSLKRADASEAGSQTVEGPLSKRYFQTFKIVQNVTKSLTHRYATFL